jgi:hypothetical protein
VISDRTRGLIIGATEGAYPLGSAADPEKIHKAMDSVQPDRSGGHGSMPLDSW